MQPRFSIFIVLLLTIQSCGEDFPSASAGGLTNSIEDKPNVILLLADDLAFSDLEIYGGEIETPNLNLLSREGVLFTHFHSSAMCSPSRAMLLTGVDQHKNGYGSMGEYLAEHQRGKPGYEGYLNNQVVTVANVLSHAGFNTYMTGKWHLGSRYLPSDRGFDQTFIFW